MQDLATRLLLVQRAPISTCIKRILDFYQRGHDVNKWSKSKLEDVVVTNAHRMTKSELKGVTPSMERLKEYAAVDDRQILLAWIQEQGRAAVDEVGVAEPVERRSDDVLPAGSSGLVVAETIPGEPTMIKVESMVPRDGPDRMTTATKTRRIRWRPSPKREDLESADRSLDGNFEVCHDSCGVPYDAWYAEDDGPYADLARVRVVRRLENVEYSYWTHTLPLGETKRRLRPRGCSQILKKHAHKHNDQYAAVTHAYEIEKELLEAGLHLTYPPAL